MKQEIKFKDFVNLRMKVGIVKSIGDKIKIVLDERDYYVNINLNVDKGDQIVVGFVEGGLVIPVVCGNIPLIPTEKVKEGSCVS